MSDERLRKLERAWKESCSETDERALLEERVRAGRKLDWDSYARLAVLNVEAAADYLKARVERGDLGQERLLLAAYCSHEPAVRLCGGVGPVPSQRRRFWVKSLPREFQHWVDGLMERSPEAITNLCVRLVLDCAVGLSEDRRQREAAALCEAWLANPGTREVEEIRSFVSRLASELDELGEVNTTDAQGRLLLQALGLVAWPGRLTSRALGAVGNAAKILGDSALGRAKEHAARFALFEEG